MGLMPWCGEHTVLDGGSRKKEYAVKVIDGRRSVGATEAQKEVMMMETLDTHFVVAVYGCGHTDRSMAIAMEYMPLRSLQNVLQQDKLPSNGHVPLFLFTINYVYFIKSELAACQPHSL